MNESPLCARYPREGPARSLALARGSFVPVALSQGLRGNGSKYGVETLPVQFGSKEDR